MAMSCYLSFGFLGSGYFAARCLCLISQTVKPRWVVTNTPKQAGRGLPERVTPVQTAAAGLEIPFLTTMRISADNELLSWIKENLPDLILVVDFGHMIKEPLLSMTRLGCLNIHPSLLPAYRGSAPVQRAILDGLDRTGVTLFKLDKGMDSGPILAQREMEIAEEDTSGSILERSAEVGSALFLNYICQVKTEDWLFKPQAQDGVSLAAKINKTEAEIDWNTPARNIYNLIRALNPVPAAYTVVKGKRLRILCARCAKGRGMPGTFVGVEEGLPLIACGEGLLRLEYVQLEGKNAQSAADWLRGARLKQGDLIF